MLVLSLPAFENKKYTAYDRFHRNGPYGEIPTEKEPIRMLGFTLPYNNDAYSSIRVQTEQNHVSICFFTTISRSKKMFFFFRAPAEKCIARHIDTSNVV